MPSFADSIFLFVLALLLFGPKRLPVLARELGKWVGEFRRASNEFKMQMEDELRASEQADRQKQIAAMEAAAPAPLRVEDAEPEHPHLRHHAADAEPEPTIMPPSAPPEASTVATPDGVPMFNAGAPGGEQVATPPKPASAAAETLDGVRPIPIAVSGDLRMMPPATGLPTPRGRSTGAFAPAPDHGLGGLDSPENHSSTAATSSDALGGLLDSIPQSTPEAASHGD